MSILLAAAVVALAQKTPDEVAKGLMEPSLRPEAALREFQIDVNEFHCLDVGASTGGFTDCLLQNGARGVVAIDVGHNQLDWRLRNDPRVEVREGVNARYLRPEDFSRKFDLAVMDVSFISATKVLPAIVASNTSDGPIPRSRSVASASS